MLKCCKEDLMEHLLKLFNRVWQQRTVTEERKDALIVPIPKKGDLSSCDNWRGISLDVYSIDTVAIPKVPTPNVELHLSTIEAKVRNGSWPSACHRRILSIWATITKY